MSNTIYFENYVEQDIRQTLGRTITETDIVIHAGQTGDFFPHHMDAEWCKTQSFGQRMAHGTLIFSVAIGMAAGVINEQAFTYGYEHLRFIKPVYIGDTIKVQVAIKEKRTHKTPDKGIVVESIAVTNQKEQLVMICDHLLLVSKRRA